MAIFNPLAVARHYGYLGMSVSGALAWLAPKNLTITPDLAAMYSPHPFRMPGPNHRGIIDGMVRIAAVYASNRPTVPIPVPLPHDPPEDPEPVRLITQADYDRIEAARAKRAAKMMKRGLTGTAA